MNKINSRGYDMTEPIKLTKDIFSCYKRNDYDNPLEIVIYVNAKEPGEIIRQQILENQEIISDIKEIISRKGQSDEDKSIIKCLKEILRENQKWVNLKL